MGEKHHADDMSMKEDESRRYKQGLVGPTIDVEADKLYCAMRDFLSDFS